MGNPKHRTCTVEGCGRVYKGTCRVCHVHRAKERTCGLCGATFRATRKNNCAKCSYTTRTCQVDGCENTYTGLGTKCGRHRSKLRPCAGCGRSFTGNSNTCAKCKRRQRTCTGCGTEFSGAVPKCYECRAAEWYAPVNGAVPENTCRTCRVTKPRTSFYLHHSRCKECSIQEQVSKQREARAPGGLRQCKHCGRSFPSDTFTYARRTCRECYVAICDRKLTARGTIVCKTCNEARPHDEYSRTRFHGECNRCYGLKRTAGHVYTTVEVLRYTYTQQNGRCVICATPGTINALNADHSKKYRRFRAYLCGACNRGIGLVYECVTTLRRMIGYLTSPELWPLYSGGGLDTPDVLGEVHASAEGAPCVKCGVSKPLSAFHRQSRPPYHVKTCKDCARAKHQNKTYGSGTALLHAKATHGGRACPLCTKPFDRTRLKSVTDHLRGTKIVRGILCSTCNSALGHFRDNPEIIKAAIAYLEYWAAVHAAEVAATAA